MNETIGLTTSQADILGTLVVAIATTVLAILTWRYVRLTAALVEENREAREPLVGIDFELPDRGLRMVVANYGQSPATNIRIRVLRDVDWATRGDGGGFANASPVADGISYLAPGRKLRYLLSYLPGEGTPAEGMVARFEVTYENSRGQIRTEEMDFDFSQMGNVLFESFRDPVQRVAEAIDSAVRQQATNRQFERFAASRGATKPCPMCAEAIPEAAKKCAHCLEIIMED